VTAVAKRDLCPPGRGPTAWTRRQPPVSPGASARSIAMVLLAVTTTQRRGRGMTIRGGSLTVGRARTVGLVPMVAQAMAPGQYGRSARAGSRRNGRGVRIRTHVSLRAGTSGISGSCARTRGKPHARPSAEQRRDRERNGTNGRIVMSGCIQISERPGTSVRAGIGVRAPMG